MCRVLDVAPSGYYERFQKRVSDRALEDARLLDVIRASCKASHGIYGARRIFPDLRAAGETCNNNRVAHVVRINRILHSMDCTRYYSTGRPSVVLTKLVKRQFNVEK